MKSLKKFFKKNLNEFKQNEMTEKQQKAFGENTKRLGFDWSKLNYVRAGPEALQKGLLGLYMDCLELDLRTNQVLFCTVDTTKGEILSTSFDWVKPQTSCGGFRWTSRAACIACRTCRH